MISKPTSLKDAGYLIQLIVIIMLLHIQRAEAQNIGIGISAPQVRLDIAGTNAWDLQNSEGDVRIGNNSFRLKIGIALGGTGAGATGIMQYGIPTGYNALSLGSQGNYLLSLYGNNKTVDIANIAGGKVGIGISPTITDGVLDINGRIRIRSGGSLANSAGAWLNNTGNSAQSAFIGMEDDNHVGFFGANGAGWKFTMNTQNGALRINGSEGSAGQVIQSNGNAAATWASPTNTLYNGTYVVNSTGFVTVGDAATAALPGLTTTFTLSGNANVVVSFYVRTLAGSCAFCGYSDTYIDIRVDGANGGRFWDHIANGTELTKHGGNVFNLAAGTHTIDLVAGNFGPNATFGNCVGCSTTSNMIIETIPQ